MNELKKAMMEVEDAAGLSRSIMKDIRALVDSARMELGRAPESQAPGFRLIADDGNALSLLTTADYLFVHWGEMIEEKMQSAISMLESASKGSEAATN